MHNEIGGVSVMNKRHFIHNPEELLKEGIEIVRTSNDKKFVQKVTLVNLMFERKITAEEISRIAGIARRTLSGWVKKVDEEGFESLKANKYTGKKPKLSEKQMEEIKIALSKPAEESGYYVWDGINLSDYIKSRYNIDLCVRQCQRLFKKLGFSRIRPQTYPSLGEPNEEERKAFKKNFRHCE